MKKEIIVVPTASLVGLTTLLTVVLSSPISFADTSTTTVTSITVSSACSITANNTIPHTATILPGHEDTEIGNTTMTVECNDASGSAIYAVGFSNDTLGTTSLIDTSTNNTIPTGTGTSSSNWSMKLSVPTGNTAPTIRSDASYDFTDYEVIPNDYALVATFSSAADGTNNSTLNATYRAYVSSSQAPGAYAGKVKYVLLHPSNMTPANSYYTINYNANGGYGMMTSSTNVPSFSAFTLPTSTFLAPTSNYAFAGWCTTNTSQYACTDGVSYENGATVTGLGDTSGAVTLYAYWKEKIYMQDLTLSQCQVNVGTGGNAANVGDSITVYDKRTANYPTGDDGDYTVRYINGACWMTQNLRIRGTVYATYSNFTGSSFNVSQYDLKTDGNNQCDDTNGYNNVCSHIPDSTDLSTVGNGATSKTVGAWYNFCAASAGTVCSKTKMDATSDICPSGWHIPTGPGNNTGTEYYIIYQDQTFGASWPISNDYLLAFDATSNYSGFYNKGGASSNATHTNWWSATAYSTTNAFVLQHNENGFSCDIAAAYYSGYSVRCVKTQS